MNPKMWSGKMKVDTKSLLSFFYVKIILKEEKLCQETEQNPIDIGQKKKN